MQKRKISIFFATTRAVKKDIDYWIVQTNVTEATTINLARGYGLLKVLHDKLSKVANEEIICVKGKQIKTVVGQSPKCPSGYKKT